MRGEAVVTADGIEGGAVYALSARLRDAIERRRVAPFSTSISGPISPTRPWRSASSAPRKGQSASTFLRKAAGLSPVGIALLREASPALPVEPDALARLIKAVPLRADRHEIPGAGHFHAPAACPSRSWTST